MMISPLKNLPHDTSPPGNDDNTSSTADDASLSKELLLTTVSTANDTALSMESVPEFNSVIVYLPKKDTQ